MKKICSIYEAHKKIIQVIVAVLLLCFPFLITNSYFLHVAISIGVYVLLSMSLNLVTGYAGQLCLGQAACYGIGAYTGSLLMLNYNVNFFLAMIVSALVSGLFGFLLGLPTLRLKGDYLAIVTLGFGEIVHLVFVNWADVTRGPMGLPGIPSPSLFGISISGRKAFYYMALILVVLFVVFMRRLINSGVGMAMETVKTDEIAAESIGIYPIRYKLLAFVLASAMAGLAGCFYATYISYISPTTFVYNTSVTILAMVVLGGMGSIAGSVIGAAIVTLVPELLRFLSDYRMLIFGAVMVIMMIYKPEGFWGASKRVKNIYKIDAERRTHERNTERN
ncbi:MAG: branched-chain amino acid ABC transporter permease [Clostridiales bacterium]|nr:branched-chain amino acid ABC transporter permease [Clostridiales bacterium]